MYNTPAIVTNNAIICVVVLVILDTFLITSLSISRLAQRVIGSDGAIN